MILTSNADPSLQNFVSEYYGKLLSSSADLKTNACCASGAPPAWIKACLQNVHEEVQKRFYGCGFPIPSGLEGATVLDLGCGTGRDVYVLAQLVGAKGRVYGLDMTPEQLAVAQDTEQWHADRFGFERKNTAFYQGFIEDLRACGIQDSSLDVVVSNCVVNLSPRKDLVLAEAYRALKPGGELYISDVFADRRLPEALATDPVLYAECLGGAMYQGDFVTLAKRTGFLDPRVVSTSAITVNNDALAHKIGAARFVSVTYRLFKLQDLDAQCEDYGQIAVYNGGATGAESVLWLDDHHAFEAHRPERVCANTALMLTDTRFAKWFTVHGAKQTHFGLFDCGPTIAAKQYAASNNAIAGPGCC
jgi:SAM-dependent methyltransferase